MNHTRKVIYCVTDLYGAVSGPPYGRFFSEFPQSPEGKEHANTGSDNLRKVALALTWLMNRPGSVFLGTAHTSQRCAVWTVQVEEPIEPK